MQKKLKNKLNILLDIDKNFYNKAEYVFRSYCTILQIIPVFYYGSTRKKIDIYYGSKVNTSYPVTIKYKEGTSDFFQANKYYPQFKVRFNNYKNEKIPFFFSSPGAIFSVGRESYSINKDIIASGFYFLSCWKEYVNKKNTDPDIRFKYQNSMQYKWDFAEIPVVDAYCDILDNILDLSLVDYEKSFRWRHEHGFCVTLSHDIDYWDVWSKDQYKAIMKYNQGRLLKDPFRSLYKIIGHTLTKNFYNPEKAIKKILNKEKRLGVRSTNFILVQDNSEDRRRNYFSDDKYKSGVKKVFSPQNVGLHGSPDSAYFIKETKKELERLQKIFPDQLGYRSHKLSFQYQSSYDILEKMNLKYDASLGYWEHIGFRAGISFPFYPYDIDNDKPFNILEIPLIVMDTTLISKLGMGHNPFVAAYRLGKLIQRAKKFQSHISLLWHNNTFDSIDYPAWSWLYWSTIRKAKRMSAMVCSTDDLYDYWIRRMANNQESDNNDN
jgi:hypothetical protein